LRILGIEVEHGEELEPSKPRYHVGDLDHLKIIELRAEGLPFTQIGKKVGVGHSTAHNHVAKHNKSVRLKGACPQCSRAKSPLAQEIID